MSHRDIDIIDAIETVFGLEFHAPMAMKFILGHKTGGRPAEDLAQARWHLDRLLAAEGRAHLRRSVDPHQQDAFTETVDLCPETRMALLDVMAAIASRDYSAYRFRLRSAVEFLTRAIALNQREAAP